MWQIKHDLVLGSLPLVLVPSMCVPGTTHQIPGMYHGTTEKYKYKVLNIEYKVLNIEYKVLNIEYKVLNIEYRVLNIATNRQAYFAAIATVLMIDYQQSKSSHLYSQLHYSLSVLHYMEIKYEKYNKTITGRALSLF